MCDQVTVREVGLRDGLQLVKNIVSTKTKLDWCQQQAACGFTEIEVTSFVPPGVIPQFADAIEVLSEAQKVEGLKASVLVPNLKGALIALDNDARQINFVLSASAAHNRANVRMSIKQSMSEFRKIIAERNRRRLNSKVKISGGIATAFGCTIQGVVPEATVYEIASQYAEAGADEITIADTVGYADPTQVKRILGGVYRTTGEIPLTAHFHDTRSMAIANVVAAVETGVRRFDATLGGLGGCPFAPGASGNVATEDCVYALECLGLDTGIDIEQLLVVRKQLETWLPGELLRGSLLLSGISKTFRPAAKT